MYGADKMITYLHIHAINDMTTLGRMHFGHTNYPCVIGRSGRCYRKREGDGKTPVGCWMVRQGYFRADRQRRFADGKLLRALKKTDGWCDDPASGRYNQHVSLPLDRSHESMWRNDGAYDVVFPTDHNQRPCLRGAGSAIFFHLTRAGVDHTAGCIAVSPAVMRKILLRCGPRVYLVIWPSQGVLSGGLRK
jgi:L,D-peptidoglycan transpeptidase YkuD (ErfK/YbiS/YcfS/YnhG family)